MAVAWLVSGCAGSNPTDLSAGVESQSSDPAVLAVDSPPAAGLPVSLPADFRLPWEKLDDSGLVIPGQSSTRMASAINPDSEFAAGVDRFSESGDVADLDQASSISSGSMGQSLFSYATYRLEMAGAQPGVIAVDVNLKARGDGALSDYWLGISDYGAGQWQWHGPLTDGQARLSLEPGEYISGLGNLFVVLAAFDGSAFDVVGVAANALNELDTEAPPAPDAPLITPITGGLLLTWLPVAASDLAGYYVYCNSAPFFDELGTGVRRISYLEATHSHVLPWIGQAYLRLTAVDISGNESEMSALVSAEALAGEPLEVILQTDLVSGLLGDTANLTATGADAYDFDLDGDGIYEITGDLTGTAAVDTTSTGLIRPKVRASDSSGSAKALGSVSLIIAAQMPPVAIVEATPDQGVLWRQPETVSVTLDASLSYDQDGTSLEYSFDPLGDGSFSAFDPDDSFDFEYAASGMYRAAVKVKDADGLVDYSFVPVTIRQVSGFDARNIDPFGSKGEYSSMAIVDGNPAITMYDSNSGFLLYMRATDPGGNLWEEARVIDASGASIYTSLAVIAGHPAVSYFVAPAFEVRYLRADDPQGASWTSTPVVIEVTSSMATDLAEVNGNPAVIYTDNGFNLRYRRATSAAGTGDTAADWAALPFTLENAGDVDSPSLEIISGNPAVAYQNIFMQEVRYRRATTSTGENFGDWPVAYARASPLGVSVGGYVSLLEVNGRPAVCYYENGISSLQYVRALNSTGAVTDDWPVVGVQVASGGNDGWHNSMAIVDGRPCISFVANHPWIGLFYSRAVDADGTAFEPRVTVFSESAESVGHYSSLVEIDGLPAISYWNITDDNIGYATPEFN